MMLKKMLFMALSGFALLASAHAATVSGRIVDEHQRPVEGARVDISAVPGGAGAFRPLQKSRLSARDGAFAFSVPAGTYRLCASLRGGRLLDPCLWSKKPPTVTVADNQALAMMPVALLRGYPVRVTFVDPGGMLNSAVAKHSANIVTVGFVAPNGMFHPAPAATQSTTRREHVLMIPRDLPVTISVLNSGFNVMDQQGNALSSGNRPYRFTAIVAGERRPRSFTFKISGLAQQTLP